MDTALLGSPEAYLSIQNQMFTSLGQSSLFMAEPEGIVPSSEILALQDKVRPAAMQKRMVLADALYLEESSYYLTSGSSHTLAGQTAHYSALNGPWGPMLVVWLENALLAVHLLNVPITSWQEEVQPQNLIGQWQGLKLEESILTLPEFNAKKELLVAGTDFQLKVWRALLGIPKGYCTNYSALGVFLGIDRAARAIGTAVGANVLAGVIPCHRVVGRNGALTGFRWSINRKALMLAHEAMTL